MQKIKQNAIYFILCFYALVSVIILFTTNGTGDNGSGDSVQHFLYAKYATTDFALFLNHWAKPFFVFLSFPFAKFGFIGIKVFNITASLLSIYYTFKTAAALKLKNAILAPVILLFTPLFFILSFSGLTEPLFTLFVIFSAYLFTQKRYLLGVVLLSFLPFIRSEGLIMIGVFAFYLLIKKQWKYLPLLSLGHVLYSIVGFFHYQDFLWVFNKIPYAKLSSTYGDGGLLHYVHQLFYVIGAPIYFLLIIGFVSILFYFLKQKKELFSFTHVVILGGFSAFFVAHTLFWYLGIFNSMGLKRVLISIAPFMALIALMGFNFLTDNIKHDKLKRAAQIVILLTIIFFPISGNKAGINWKKDFSLSVSQQEAFKAVQFIQEELGSKNKTFLFSDPYLSEALNINYFDKSVRQQLTFENIKNLKPNDIIVWDDWFAVVENGVRENPLKALKSIQEIKVFTNNDGKREIKYIIFVKK